MKIIIRNATPLGTFLTYRIEITNKENFEEIKTKIEEKIGIKKQFQILKYKRDGFSVILINNKKTRASK